MTLPAPLLLDTCAVIWILKNEHMKDGAVSAINDASETGEAIFASPISAWEIGQLVSRGRLSLSAPPLKLFSAFLDTRGARLAELPPSVLIDSSFLPGTPPNDPADRIIIATAREFGLQIVTRDRRILDYAEQGHVQALAC